MHVKSNSSGDQNVPKTDPKGTCKTVSVLHVPSGPRNGALSEPSGPNSSICSAVSGVPSRPCDLSHMIKLDWFPAVRDILSHTKVFNRMCWLKTISNAWHTTSRMHEDVKWPCIFGCLDCTDTLMHYLICPVLWQIANEIIGHEPSVHIGSRLCLCLPSETKLKRLAMTHAIYHFCKFDATVQHLVSQAIFSLQLVSNPWQIIQETAAGYARTVEYMVL